MTIDVQLVGLTEFQARLGSMSSGVWAKITMAMDQIVQMVADRARSRMAELFKDAEKMQDSVATSVDDGPPVTGTIGAYGLPYLRIQEYGGVTSPHDIFPVNAAVLAFLFPGGSVPFKDGASSGGMVFARVVHHPGSKIPERSYMRSALDMERTNIILALQAAAEEGINARS